MVYSYCQIVKLMYTRNLQRCTWAVLWPFSPPLQTGHNPKNFISSYNYDTLNSVNVNLPPCASLVDGVVMIPCTTTTGVFSFSRLSIADTLQRYTVLAFRVMLLINTVSPALALPWDRCQYVKLEFVLLSLTSQ